MLLPVLLVSFAGIVFLQQAYMGRQQQWVQARRCGWHYAMTGCDASAVLDGCAGGVQNRGSSEHAETLTHGLAAIDVPVLNQALRVLFGSTHSARSSHQLQRPGLLGGGRFDRSFGVHVPCNARGTNLGSILRDAWNWLTQPESTAP